LEDWANIPSVDDSLQKPKLLGAQILFFIYTKFNERRPPTSKQFGTQKKMKSIEKSRNFDANILSLLILFSG
jgi:hypothetical protein